MFQKPLPVLFITGISSGIGLFLAKSLNLKYNIIGTVRQEGQKISIEASIPNLKVYCMDLNQSKSIERALNEMKADFPGLKIAALINNAGIAKAGAIVDLPMDEFEEQIRVNLISQVQIIQGVFPFLVIGESRIIQISSVSGLFASPFLGAYCASKFGFEGMSDSLRREMAILGIKVILIEPGPIKTEIWQKSMGLSNRYPQSKFVEFLEGADQRIYETESKAFPIALILNPILCALEHKHPKNRYLVHRSPLLIRLLTKILPSKWVDVLVLKNIQSKIKKPRAI